MEEDKSKYWSKHVTAWRKSGLSQESYCRKNNIRKSTFGYWNTKLSKKGIHNKFVPIPIMMPIRSTLEVVIKEGIKIVVTAGFDPELLKATIRALEVL